MNQIEIKIDGYCQGAYPVEGLDELVNEKFCSELIQLISSGQNEEAEKFAIQFFSAEYILDNVDSLDQAGFEFVKTTRVSLKLPFIEENDEFKIPLFKWIGAEFLISGPSEIILKWLKIENDKYKFDNDLFNTWMEDNGSDSLQDGCSYSLGSAWYDLEGFGENGCSINTSFIEDTVNDLDLNS